MNTVPTPFPRVQALSCSFSGELLFAIGPPSKNYALILITTATTIKELTDIKGIGFQLWFMHQNTLPLNSSLECP